MIEWQPPKEVGSVIPAHEEHGVSVSLPTWNSVLAYEKGEQWIVDLLRIGYPRFKIHWRIEELAKVFERKYGLKNERAMLFPHQVCARRARDFMRQRASIEKLPGSSDLRIVQLCTPGGSGRAAATVVALFFPEHLFKLAKQYWQHTGEGISSRLAEYFAEAQNSRQQAAKRAADAAMGSPAGLPSPEALILADECRAGEPSAFLEQRLGRNLDLEQADEAKGALRRRIAQHISEASTPLSDQDVWLYPTGMTAIFAAYRLCLQVNNAVGPDGRVPKVVCFGFPYTDTLKVLQKWGTGCIFYPFGSDDEITELHSLLASGQRISSVFCEVPSNPLLKTPNLRRLRELADEYEFLLVVDETVGNACNIDTLKYTDIAVSSLTKIFSGESNVMGGSLVLHPTRAFAQSLRQALAKDYIDIVWVEDAIYLERNSRDFLERSKATNRNAEAVVNLVCSHPLVQSVYHPIVSETKKYYDDIKRPDGGYGGLLSIVLPNEQASIKFFDSLQIHKGPSLGTNFSLACPYALLAHFTELDWVEKCGVDPNIIRISIGLEPTEKLLAYIQTALDKAMGTTIST